MTKSTHSYDRYLQFPFLCGFSIWTIFLLLILSPPAFTLPTSDTNTTNATNSLNTIDGLQSNGCDCRKLKWYEFVSFYALNYGAHAFSVITPPGCSLRRSIIWVIFCLCFPYAGVGAPVVLLASLKHLPWNENPFEKALRAGALCMVIRTHDWRPLDNGTAIPASYLKVKSESVGQPLVHNWRSLVNGITIPTLHLKASKQASETDSQIPPGTYEVLIAGGEAPALTTTTLLKKIFPKLGGILNGLMSRTIQGQYDLPKGFDFAPIPPSANIHKNYPSLKNYPKLSHSSQTIKTLTSSAQVCVAAFTLLRVSSECGQLKKYGSASPAITVIPYGIMSFMNAIANSFTPSYPAQYIIGSSILDEAKLYGGKFDTVVGRLEEIENSDHHRNVISIGPYGKWLTEVRENTRRNGEAVDGARQERLDTEQEQALEENYGARSREQDGIQESDRRESDNNESKRDQLYLAVSPSLETNRDSVKRNLFIQLIQLILLAAPFIITRSLTYFNYGFSKEENIYPEVIFTWLIMGIFWGLDVSLSDYTRASQKLGPYFQVVQLVLTPLCAMYSIWGFVAVGEMLNELGECTQLS